MGVHGGFAHTSLYVFRTTKLSWGSETLVSVDTENEAPTQVVVVQYVGRNQQKLFLLEYIP